MASNEAQLMNIMHNIKQVIAVRKDLSMRKGKIAAQVAHAAMKFIIDNDESEKSDELHVKLSINEATWIENNFTKIVVSVDSEDELQHLMLQAQLKGIPFYSIIDSGKTEFNGIPTLTCCAFGPDESEILDQLTGNLKLM